MIALEFSRAYHDLPDESQDEYAALVAKMDKALPLLALRLSRTSHRENGPEKLRQGLQILLQEDLLTQRTQVGTTRLTAYPDARIIASLAATLWWVQSETAPRAEALSQPACCQIAADVATHVDLEPRPPGLHALQGLVRMLPRSEPARS